MKRLFLICMISIAAFAQAPAEPKTEARKETAKAAAITPITDAAEKDALSIAQLDTVMAKNNLLEYRQANPRLLQLEDAVNRADAAYGVMLQKARAAHNAPGCELTAAKAWSQCPPPAK